GDPGGGEPAHPRVLGRSGRHAHADAPGSVPRRGHQRPPAARGQRAGADDADRRRPAQRTLPRRRSRARAGVRGVTAMTITNIDRPPMDHRAKRVSEEALDFELPPELEAREPAEARGLPRDGVRLMVSDASSGRIEHTAFNRIQEYLEPGDLLVVND